MNDGKRHPLNMRTTKRIRGLVEAAAKDSGRSLAAEVESILERHFEREAALAEMQAGSRLVWIPTNRPPEVTTTVRHEVTRGSGNVFADLGVSR